MDKITDVRFTDLGESNFVKPLRMHYTQDGKKKTWDLLKIHDSVAVLIYNTSRQVLVFVHQFRPAVYYNGLSGAGIGDGATAVDTEKCPGGLGMTLELCAGIVDKKKSLAEIAREEVLEECGYDVPLSKLEKIKSFRAGVGVTGDRQHLFYTEVTDTMKVSAGGGIPHEGEMIDVVEMPLAEVREYMSREEVKSPGGFLFAVLWFFHNKIPHKD